MTEPWVPEGGGSEMSEDAEDRGGRQGGGAGEHCFSFPSEAPRLKHAVNPNLISEKNNEKKGSRPNSQAFAFSALRSGRNPGI